MTPDEIRALYVETLARAEHGHMNKFRAVERQWDAVAEAERDEWRRPAGRAVDALAEAGLLPTQVEETGSIPVYSDDETIAYWQPGSRRFVTERREVTE